MAKLGCHLVYRKWSVCWNCPISLLYKTMSCFIVWIFPEIDGHRYLTAMLQIFLWFSTWNFILTLCLGCNYEHIMGPVRNVKRKATLLLMPLSGWVKQSTLVYIVEKSFSLIGVKETDIFRQLLRRYRPQTSLDTIKVKKQTFTY